MLRREARGLILNAAPNLGQFIRDVLAVSPSRDVVRVEPVCTDSPNPEPALGVVAAQLGTTTLNVLGTAHSASSVADYAARSGGFRGITVETTHIKVTMVDAVPGEWSMLFLPIGTCPAPELVTIESQATGRD